MEESTAYLDSSTKKNTASHVKLTLNIKVTCCDFHKDSSTLCLHDHNLQPNQHVTVSSFHTLTLEPHKPFHLRKKLWQNDVVKTLNESIENSNLNTNSPNLIVVLFHPHHVEIHLIAHGVATRCTKIELSSNSRNSMFFRLVFAMFV
ncbi:hypothetical protein JHK87_049268 [Glycine soja]|nr:hypothetical protein JHK87_049268 [Glycine soja]